MNATLLIARRELGAYLRSMTGYIIGAALLLVEGLLFNSWGISGEKLSADVLANYFLLAFGVTPAWTWLLFPFVPATCSTG